MRTVVKKCGNSASVRIPVAVMKAAHLDLNGTVEVREESGRIISEPAPRREFDLGELAKGITRENLHDEADFRQTCRQRGVVMAPSYAPDVADIVWVSFKPQTGHEGWAPAQQLC